jgi:hypothetical protein
MNTTKLTAYQAAKASATVRDGVSLTNTLHPTSNGPAPDDIDLNPDSLVTVEAPPSLVVMIEADKLLELVSLAMKARRRELIAQPLDRIWGELAKTAIEEIGRKDLTEAGLSTIIEELTKANPTGLRLMRKRET